jgi:hypothetical protein
MQTGIKRAPALDQKFLTDVLAGIPVGEGRKWLKYWLAGWDAANLKTKED